jgi:hypothetical protein
MMINLRQNTNDESTAYGKFFAEVERKVPINLKGFCRHMTEHGKIASYQMCELVVMQMVECLKELITQGQPAAMINGIYLNFQPENTKGEKLTSKALKDDCIFEWGYVIKSLKKTIGGKERRYQEKVPIATYGIAVAEADGAGSGSGGEGGNG